MAPSATGCDTDATHSYGIVIVAHFLHCDRSAGWSAGGLANPRLAVLRCGLGAALGAEVRCGVFRCLLYVFFIPVFNDCLRVVN